jgi:hypothetical protein
MACITCAIRDLEKHQTHLKGLNESMSILQQLYITSTCLSMFLERLRDFGVDRYSLNECGCTGHENNRMSSWPDDIVITRVGHDALEHYAMFGETLLQQITLRRGLEGDKSLEDITKTYEDTERRYRATLRRLQRNEKLISYETMTRGYRIDFMGMSNEALKQLGWP